MKMNWINHFIFSIICLKSIVEQASFSEIIIFSLLFSVLVDLDLAYSIINRNPRHHLRTWVQEPLAILIIGLPIAVILSLVKPYYLLMVLIPYASHVLLDYITIHEVEPFAPFSKKKINVGIVRAFPAKPAIKAVSEHYMLMLNIILLVIVLF